MEVCLNAHIGQPQARRVWLECTSTERTRYNTGIQRAARNLVDASLDSSQEWACRPIVHNGRFFEAIDGLPDLATGARRSSVDFLRLGFHRVRVLSLRIAPFAHAALHSPWLEYALRRSVYGFQNALRWGRSLTVPASRRVQFSPGDVLVLLDPAWSVDLTHELRRAKREGAIIWMVVNDLIPIQSPQLAPEGRQILMDKWLRQVVPLADGALGISMSVAADLRAHLDAIGIGQHLRVDYFYLGAGLGEIDGSNGDLAELARIFSGGRVYLMVGTIEPRKNHAMVIDAFERLWKDGSKAKLLVVGRLGWRSDELARRLASHPERGRRLLWLDTGSDAQLDFAYRRASALIFPSLCEGFGLPLVEAMRYGLPVIANDIAVFREVGGAFPRYVNVSAAGALELAIREFENELENKPERNGPTRRQAASWISWRESAQMLLTKVTDPRG